MTPGRALLFAALLAAGSAPALAQDTAGETRAEVFASLPYWGGQWLTENNTTSIGGFADATLAAREEGRNAPTVNRALFGFDAPWSEEGRKRLAAARAKAGGRKADGWGFPLMMNAAAPLIFSITPEEVIVMNAYRDVRIIRTDGKGHPPEEDLWPTVWGDSVGHWEGDTLVVSTIMVKNPNDYFHGSPPLSEQARYLERIWLDEETGLLVDEMTIEDPVALTAPWHVRLTFMQAEGFDRMILDAYDNDRTGFDGQFNTIEPDEVGP